MLLLLLRVEEGRHESLRHFCWVSIVPCTEPSPQKAYEDYHLQFTVVETKTQSKRTSGDSPAKWQGMDFALGPTDLRPF